MELNSFLNLRDDLRIHYTKIGFKFKIIEKKIYVLKGTYLTISFFYNKKEKYMKLYYIDSSTCWIYKIRFYRENNEKSLSSRIKNYIKELENKKLTIY